MAMLGAVLHPTTTPRLQVDHVVVLDHLLVRGRVRSSGLPNRPRVDVLALRTPQVLPAHTVHIDRFSSTEGERLGNVSQPLFFF